MSQGLGLQGYATHWLPVQLSIFLLQEFFFFKAILLEVSILNITWKCLYVPRHRLEMFVSTSPTFLDLVFSGGFYSKD